MKRFITENSVKVVVYIIAIVLIFSVFILSDALFKLIIIVVLTAVVFCLFKVSKKDIQIIYKHSSSLIPFIVIVVLFLILALYKIDLIPFRITFYEYQFLSAFTKGKISSFFFINPENNYLLGVNQYIVSFVLFIISFLGTKIIILRIISVITFAFTIILAFIFFKNLTNNKIIPYISVFLMVVSPWCLLISRTGFLESLILVVSLLTFIALLRAMNTNKLRWYVLTGVFAALCVYIRLEYICIILVPLLILFISSLNKFQSPEIKTRYLFLTLISFVVVVLPLMIYVTYNLNLLNVIVVNKSLLSGGDSINLVWSSLFNYIQLLYFTSFSAQGFNISSVLGFFQLLGFILILKHVKEKENYFILIVVFIFSVFTVLLNDNQLDLYYRSAPILPLRYFIIGFALYTIYIAIINRYKLLTKKKMLFCYSVITLIAIVVLVCNINSFFVKNSYADTFYDKNFIFQDNFKIAEKIKEDLLNREKKSFVYINDGYNFQQILFLLEHVCDLPVILFKRLKSIDVPVFNVGEIPPSLNYIVYYIPVDEIDFLQVNYNQAIIEPIYNLHSTIFSYKITLNKDLSRNQFGFSLNVIDNIKQYKGIVFFNTTKELVLKPGNAVKSLKINEDRYDKLNSLPKIEFQKGYNDIEYTCDKDSNDNECNILVYYDDIRKIEDVFSVSYDESSRKLVSFYDDLQYKGKLNKHLFQKTLNIREIEQNFKGYFNVAESGKYELAFISDDGASLYVDNKIVLDNSGRYTKIIKANKLFLKEGKHTFSLLFNQCSGNYTLQVGVVSEYYTPFEHMYIVFKNKNLDQGVNFKLYSERDDKRKLLKQAIVKDFDFNNYKEMNYCSINLKSYLRIVEDGFYEFSLYSNNNTKVSINGVPLCFNSGMYNENKSLKLYLFKGFYNIEMSLLQDRRKHIPVLKWKPPFYNDFIAISELYLYKEKPYQ